MIYGFPILGLSLWLGVVFGLATAPLLVIAIGDPRRTRLGEGLDASFAGDHHSQQVTFGPVLNVEQRTTLPSKHIHVEGKR